MEPRWIRGFFTFLCSLDVSLVESWSTSFRPRPHLLDLDRTSSASCSRRPVILNTSSDHNIASSGGSESDHYHNQAQVFLVQTSSTSLSAVDATAAQHDSNGTPLSYYMANDGDSENDSDPIIQFLPIEISSGTAATGATPSTSTTAVGITRQAATETWNWCAHFVARHNLCPWAGASVREPFAIRFYGWVDPQENLLEAVLERVATDFVHDLERQRSDPNTAIAFVLLLPSQSSREIKSSTDDSWWYKDFASFYDCFFELEEQWPMQEKVTLAPFHPQWKYFGEEQVESLELEKQSPHATISLVSTATIDKAGEAATEQIAANNENVLLQKSATEWRRIYENAVHLSARSIDDEDDDIGSFQ